MFPKENNNCKEIFNKYLILEDDLFCYQMMDNGFKASYMDKKKIEKITFIKISQKKYTYYDLKSIKSLSKNIALNLLLNNIDLNLDEPIKNKDIILNFFNNQKYKNHFLSYVKNFCKEFKNYYYSGVEYRNFDSLETENKKNQIKLLKCIINFLIDENV